MKNVLILSLVVFLGWCFGGALNAQNCKPSPACKAVCAKMKADATANAEVAPMATAQKVSSKKSCSAARVHNSAASVQTIPVNWLDFGTASASMKAKANCDPKNCDPRDCDPTKCDWSKCIPASCAGKGGKAAVVRL